MDKIKRRIDDLCRIVIPRDIQKRLGFKEGDWFEISVNQQGEIVLKKTEEPES